MEALGERGKPKKAIICQMNTTLLLGPTLTKALSQMSHHHCKPVSVTGIFSDWLKFEKW